MNFCVLCCNSTPVYCRVRSALRSKVSICALEVNWLHGHARLNTPCRDASTALPQRIRRSLAGHARLNTPCRDAVWWAYICDWLRSLLLIHSQTPNTPKSPNTPKTPTNPQNPNISGMAERWFPTLLHVIDGRR